MGARTIGWMLLLWATSGCVEAHSLENGQGLGPDASTPDAPTPSLAVEEAFWDGPSALSIAIRLDNPGAEPLPLEPGRFVLEDGAGLRRVAARDDGVGACHRDGSVAPFARARCVVSFALDPSLTDAGELSVGYTRGGTTARAPVPSCALERPGLCAPGRLCVDGECRRACSPSRWDGVCAAPDEVCSEGRCVERCSPERPEGGCDEGRCVEGRCVLDCPTIAWTDAECWTCAWDVLDGGRCRVAEDCQDCFDCPGSPPERPSTCECAAACGGCAREIEPAWECLLAACVACRD